MKLTATARMKQFFRRYPAIRTTYRRLYFFYSSPAIRKRVWRLREWIDYRKLGQPKPARNFSVEFTITGRNDEYEPGWNERLEAILAYNRAIFSYTGVDFRVAFVEWNPPVNRPLLSTRLLEKFPFVRAIAVAPHVHRNLCKSPSLQMMLNFSLNAAMRTSESDFILISGGDVFLGRDVARWLSIRGLRAGCLYRATRVDIRRDLDLLHPEPNVLEAPETIIRVNETDRPPYYNACGDFILMDRTSMQKIRGFDENVRHRRLHLDSRCCATAMALGLTCQLIGHVYHVDHHRSYVNAPAEPFEEFQDSLAGIPYRNPDTWGLGDREWKNISQRLKMVS